MIEIYTSSVLGNQYNTCYPERVEVTDDESLKRAVEHDYVCAEYKDFRRRNANFIRSNCLAFDVDNDTTDDEDSWITPEKIVATFPDVRAAFHYSRNHMQDKLYIDESTGEVTRTVTARPRFHVFFEITPVFRYEEYKKLKEKVLAQFPYFDEAAMDAARFFYGTEEPQVKYIEGKITLEQYLNPPDFEAELSKIPSGIRNKTLSEFAAKVLTRYGDTDVAYEKFLEKNEYCVPPLEDAELSSIWASALRFYNEKVLTNPDYVPPEQYGTKAEDEDTRWDDPIPFGNEEMPPFPVDALPKVLRDYAVEVGVSTQTPVDMAAVATLTTVSACMRNLYKVAGKPDWHEPTNIYSVIIAEPSERKSAIISHATKPVDEYVREENEKNKVDIEVSKADKQRLENKKNKLISESKKKGESKSAEEFNDELRHVIDQIVNFNEVKALKVYVDDVTPERLTETLAENGGAISIISSEGGIFDVLSGTYSNKVNIDVFLKAYSGEHVSVERIMRAGASVDEACLTILLSVQPVVIGELMSNKKFRHRGLCARFLYTTPKSFVGSRTLNSEPISKSSYQAYRKLIYDILSEEKQGDAELIHLTADAKKVLTGYFDWVEKRLTGEFSMYSDWLGKMVGQTLRVAGILARCNVIRNASDNEFLKGKTPVTIDKKVMEDAISIGKYFMVHAVHAYGEMGIRTDFKASLMVIEKIQEKGLKQITRRDVMRICRWVGSADEAQSIINNLEDYGYVRLVAVDVSDKLRNGRPKNAVFAVNPKLLE